MSDIISLDARLEALRAERLQRFIELDARFQRTKRMEDGIAAGRAKNEFYDLFTSPAERRANVIFRDFGRRDRG